MADAPSNLSTTVRNSAVRTTFINTPPTCSAGWFFINFLASANLVTIEDYFLETRAAASAASSRNFSAEKYPYSSKVPRASFYCSCSSAIPRISPAIVAAASPFANANAAALIFSKTGLSPIKR